MTELVRAAQFRRGDPAPVFAAATNLGHEVQLQSAAGRYVVLAFPGPLTLPATCRFFQEIARLSAEVDPRRCLVSAVVTETGAVDLQSLPAEFLVFIDPGAAIYRTYGALSQAAAGAPQILWPYALILDPNLHVLEIVPFGPNSSCGEIIRTALSTLPEPSLHSGFRSPAPVLVVPRVFEPELCRHLIGCFAQGVPADSGFMIERDGVTLSEINHRIKRRRDLEIADASVRAVIRQNIAARLVPDIEKAFQHRPTRMDRYIIACYEAATGGYFRPHRDNVSSGTAHRRFALTVNLNPDEYDGGDLRFPEFSDVAYRAAAGAAIVFSCSLLHEVTPITRGRRFAFLAFMYGELDAATRERNNRTLRAGEYQYVSGPDLLQPDETARQKLV